MNKLIIEGPTPELTKYLTDWLDRTGMNELMISMMWKASYDLIVYGYNPWNYVKELELNMKLQGFIDTTKRWRI